MKSLQTVTDYIWLKLISFTVILITCLDGSGLSFFEHFGSSSAYNNLFKKLGTEFGIACLTHKRPYFIYRGIHMLNARQQKCNEIDKRPYFMSCVTICHALFCRQCSLCCTSFVVRTVTPTEFTVHESTTEISILTCVDI